MNVQLQFFILLMILPINSVTNLNIIDLESIEKDLINIETILRKLNPYAHSAERVESNKSHDQNKSKTSEKHADSNQKPDHKRNSQEGARNSSGFVPAGGDSGHVNGTESLENKDRGALRTSLFSKREAAGNLILDAALGEDHWSDYKLVFNKSYLDHQREKKARQAWLENAQLVATHNQQYLKGGHDYALQLNHFADLSLHDYLMRIVKLVKAKPMHDPAEDHTKAALQQVSGQLPDAFDWRDQGFKPRLEEQRRCGSCYAFSIAHALQGQLYKKHKIWSELSVQQVVDCSTADGNYGCGGGSLRGALRYASRAGLEGELEYPYFAKKGICRYNVLSVRARASQWALLPYGDELAMARALVSIGPLAISINASPRSFQLYKSGIYDDLTCSSHVVNHAMLLVGYGRGYWTILNWWGPHWGEGGYMRIRRGYNRCGIANGVAYVQIA